MKDWIKDLIEEYPTGRSDTAIKRLMRVYAEVDDITMQRAVDRYLVHEKFFPKVADLRPYVEAAPYDIDEQGVIHYYGRWKSPHQVTDETLYEFEAQRDESWGSHDYWDVVVEATSKAALAETPY